MARRRGKRTLGRGRWLELLEDDGWEYVQRRKATAIVVIVAVTRNREMLFVEQYRKPVDAVCVELPAGLAGDVAGQEDEALETAARRELLEETGYEARTMKILTAGPPSAGQSTEIVTFLRAEGLRKTGAGGGDEAERITVHLVPLRRVRRWLRQQSEQGKVVDPKIWAGLFFAMK